MIFLKKKKLVFVLKKDDYTKLLNQYGKPELTAFGEHVWEQDGRKWVKEITQGKIIVRTKDVRYLGTRDDLHYYLCPGDKVPKKMIDQYASFYE
jgi:hypothetical protein